MKKVLLIGIDGMDPYLIDKWKNELPNIKKLKLYYSESVFPPDSVPAWITIFTGKNPAEHGIIESIDYLNIQKESFNLNKGDYKGKTFWDLLSRKGKKVCIINPFLAYPPWKVNGVMVSGQVFVEGNNQSYPPDFIKNFPPPPLGGIEDFPKNSTLKEFIEKTKEDTKNLAEYGLRVLKNNDWDIFFITFLILDRFQHFLWRFTDKDDITYPGENEFSYEIKEMYKLFEKIIGEFVSSTEKDTSIMIFSDHGHGRRCQYCFNINELLRKKNYLVLKQKSFLSPKRFVEIMKNLTLKVMYKLDLADFVIKISKFVPYKKTLQKSSYLINKNESLVYASDFAGTNPFGGVIINKELIKLRGLNYEDIKKEVIQLFENYEFKGKKLIKWIKPREEVMKGNHLNKLPELLIQLDADYGFNWTLFNDVVSINPTHKKISGGHKMEGVLLTNLEIKGEVKISDYYKMIVGLV